MSFWTSFFHKIPFSFNTKTPMLNRFFECIAIELSGLFSKPFSCSSLNLFITCEMNSSEMFCQNCKEPEVMCCQIQAVQCRTTSNLMFSVTAEMAALTWGLALH